MARWIEIPASRVLEVSHAELATEFVVYNRLGEEIASAGDLYRAFRKKDVRLFKPAALVPVNEIGEGMVYLQEA